MNNSDSTGSFDHVHQLGKHPLVFSSFVTSGVDEIGKENYVMVEHICSHGSNGYTIITIYEFMMTTIRVGSDDFNLVAI